MATAFNAAMHAVTLARTVALAAALACTSAGIAPANAAGTPALQPFPMDWTNAPQSALDLSRFLEAPAGGKGFLRVQGNRVLKPDGSRFRVWGVNLCSEDCFPSHEDAALIAGDLARMGVNVVRFHHMDAHWGRNIFDPSRDDTRRLSSENLDRLDFFIAELNRRGIYANLNLNVHRQFKAGDGVRDWKVLGIGKSATYFNPRLIELQEEYARQLLTHRNAYSGREYRDHPGVAVVELINENSLLEGWTGWRLVGRDDKPGDTWSPIPVSYAEELTDLFNSWLATNVPSATLAAIRKEAGAGSRVPRLMPNQFTNASPERFRAEAKFYMEVEKSFFFRMKRLLRDELGVRSILVGTADHNDGYAAYAHIQANMLLDLVDGHGYWEHPNLGAQTWIKNTPMVNDPLDATVTQFARTPFSGLPYTISEVNHPFPHRYASEGFPILTAYALLHDWDGIYWFTWGRGRLGDPKAGIQRNGWFDFSNDPIKLASLYACGLMWHRRDLASARQTVVRAYDSTQVLEALRLDRGKERPFFTPGFARSTPLQHRTVWTLDTTAATPFPAPAPLEAIEADTGELGWYGAAQKRGVVRFDTERAQGLVGFVKGCSRELPNLGVAIENDFSAILLTSVDDAAIAKSSRLLLVAAAGAIQNTGQAWKDDGQTLAEWGRGPVLIEPVRGTLTLRHLGRLRGLRVQALSPVGKPIGSIPARQKGDSWEIEVGNPVTTWYMIEPAR